MTGYLSVNTIAVNIAGYPMSYIELFGTLFCLWSVWLVSQRNILTWPVGLVSVVLYLFLYYQIMLYADAIEQLYYIPASIYGWWYWVKTKNSGHSKVHEVSVSPARELIIWAVVTVILSALLGYFFSRANVLFPKVFPEPAAFPYMDSLTTVMSFVAQFLLARKRLENWVYWIIVDVIGIGLYYSKNVKFISLLYVVLLILAVRGLIVWLKEWHVNSVGNKTRTNT